MRIPKQFDKAVGCSCFKFKEHPCNTKCICYCHIPIWYRNLIWKTQEIKHIGDILVLLPIFFFQIPISIYIVFNQKELIGGNENE